MSFLKNLLTKLFTKEISVEGDELKKLLRAFGSSDKFIDALYQSRGGFRREVFAVLNIVPDANECLFKLNITPIDCPPPRHEHFNYPIRIPPSNIQKSLSYLDLRRNEVLYNYYRPNTKKFFFAISATSLLASLFFISNNLTGNAILSNVNSSASIFLGAGLFILGIISFILAKKS